MNWQPDWTGRTCFILGGGPSLRGFDADRLRGRRVIGINEAGLTMAPWCDVLMWADQRWLDWNKDRLHLHTGALKVCRHVSPPDGVHRMKFRPPGFAMARDTVGGDDCGSSAINLAVHFGASRIVLLGFDCHDLPMSRWREGNWHSAHRLPPLEGQRGGKFAPAHDQLSRDLKQKRPGVSVLNATQGSALTCWPIVDLETVID